ncbi:enoyl-CoA hydratase/isomerase family protein [Fluviibacterium sp. DFM31]|uniref:3-hydroxyisobutyryl-CoA hydrolase n=1 Tax=Meridianimarinicoccus marinus TaxID=3231483 RepID=A0ABV3L5N0_9RHOB
MADIEIRVEGKVGRMTFNRPKALNALTYDMCLAVEDALDAWREDDAVALVLIDAAGDRAFCAGGDIQEMYDTGRAGDFAYGRRFWRDEYRMNAKMYEYPKPVVSLMQGFTMGGGVGVGCHASHRVVGETSQVAMPEVGIGLVPDVGGSMILANAPGRLGEYLGTTATRMGPADAILAGFADVFVPQDRWPDLVAALLDAGDVAVLDDFGTEAPEGTLAAQMDQINAHFGGETIGDIKRSLVADGGAWAAGALKAVERNSPLAVACAVEMVHRLRGVGDIRRALDLEYRFTHRAMEHGDFIEGIRAAIIDKDRTPRWRHEGIDAVGGLDVVRMLMPLGKDALTFEKEEMA